jgi:hypothetical protein
VYGRSAIALVLAYGSAWSRKGSVELGRQSNRACPSTNGLDVAPGGNLQFELEACLYSTRSSHLIRALEYDVVTYDVQQAGGRMVSVLWTTL